MAIKFVEIVILAQTPKELVCIYTLHLYYKNLKNLSQRHIDELFLPLFLLYYYVLIYIYMHLVV